MHEDDHENALMASMQKRAAPNGDTVWSCRVSEALQGSGDGLGILEYCMHNLRMVRPETCRRVAQTSRETLWTGGAHLSRLSRNDLWPPRAGASQRSRGTSMTESAVTAIFRIEEDRDTSYIIRQPYKR